MAAKGHSFAEKFSRWGVALATLKEHLEEMPHVAADLAEMERLLSEARTLEVRQEDMRGQAREVNVRLKEITKDGERLRSRLRSHLQAKYGATSESLLKFGFRPARVPRRRAVVVVEEPKAPAPAQKAEG
jgi:hypothetical protein